MKTIYKYLLSIEDNQVIHMPRFSTPRHVGLDPKGNPCIWAEVDTLEPIQPHRFFIVGTGHPIPDAAITYLGSFVQNSFVWHVYTT